MRKIAMYLGFALAACLSCLSCLSCFSMSVLAEPVAYAYRAAVALAELPGASLKRLELTLAMWRTGSQPDGQDLKSNLRASSNHFVMTSAKPLPESDGLSPC